MTKNLPLRFSFF